MTACFRRLLQIIFGDPTSQDHSAMSAEAFSFAKKGLAKAVRSVTGDTPLDEFPTICPELARCFRLSVKLPEYTDIENALDIHNKNTKAKLEPIRFTLRNDVDDKKTILFADFNPATRGFIVRSSSNDSELLHVVLPNTQHGGGMGKFLQPQAGVSLFKMVKGPGDQNDRFLIQRTGGAHAGTFLEIISKTRLDLQAEKISQLNFDDKEYRINTVGSDVCKIAKIWPKLAPSSRTYVIELTPGGAYGYQTRVVVIGVALSLTLHVAYPELLKLIPNEPMQSS